MSYDVQITVNTGFEDVCVEECGNYTYNVSEMYYDAFDLKEGLRGLHDMGCESARKHLADAIEKMESDPSKYRKMDTKDFGIGAQILHKLKANKLNLLTNSKNLKRVGLTGYGIEIIKTTSY